MNITEMTMGWDRGITLTNFLRGGKNLRRVDMYVFKVGFWSVETEVCMLTMRFLFLLWDGSQTQESSCIN